MKRMKSITVWIGWVGVLGLAGLSGCVKPGEQLARVGDEIVVCGQLFHTGTPVRLWLDPNGYDAYRARRHFDSDKIMPSNPVDPDSPNRYGTRRNLGDELSAAVERDGWTLANLQRQVDQFVFHYDACGTSRQCFKVLHDMRGLSVHFMLDLDGTFYQTLDLKERAWHAGTANDRSVGVEIANIGAYGNMDTLDKWYAQDKLGPYMTLPDWIKESGLANPGYVARPARPQVFTGTINGREVMMYDYTEPQYRAMIQMCAALHRVFPNMRLDYPRTPDGSLRTTVFNDEEQAAFTGFMGHWHESEGKVDPGPAFNWDRVMKGARRQLGYWR